jgi:hypothetical protein
MSSPKAYSKCPNSILRREAAPENSQIAGFDFLTKQPDTFGSTRHPVTAARATLFVRREYDMVPRGLELSGQTAFSRPPTIGSAHYDERARRKHVPEHLPAIAAQPDVHSCLDSAAVNDRPEAAFRAGSSNQAFLQRNRIRNDVRRQKSNPGAESIRQSSGRFQSAECGSSVREDDNNLKPSASSRKRMAHDSFFIRAHCC